MVPLLLPAVAFLGLLALVAGGWEPLYDWDRGLSAQALRLGQDHPGWVGVMRVVTDAGATASFLLAGVALAVVLALRREYGSAAATALVVALVPVLWGVLHEVLYRPRPAGGFLTIDSSGFPSGHTSQATALAVLAVSLTWSRRGRAVTVGAAVLFAVLVGVSRVALVAHWPTDVIGGWLLGSAVVPLVMWAVPGAPTPGAPAPRAPAPGAPAPGGRPRDGR